MTATYLSLAQTRTFEPLYQCINSILELDEYRAQLAEEENKNKMLELFFWFFKFTSVFDNTDLNMIIIYLQYS